MKTKEDNEDLLKLKIDIQTHNDMAFQEIALLLDKPDFLRLLPELRETYNVKEFVSLKDFSYHTDMHFHDLLDRDVKPNLNKYKKIKKFKKMFPEAYDFLTGDNDARGKSEVEPGLVCFEFNRPYFFSDIIRQALFCNAVDNTFYRPTEAKVIDPESGDWLPEFTLPQAAIFISPNSTDKDIEKAVKEARKILQKDPRLSYYQPRIDAINNIRKYRHWYWERLKGEEYTYEKIAKDWTRKHFEGNDFTGLNVNKGIKFYKERLGL